MHKLKLTAILAATILVAGMFAFMPIQMASTQAPPAPRPADVVILGCTTFTFTVLLSSSSANAPTLIVGTNCAQALADLLDADFAITDVQFDQRRSIFSYTLVRV